MALENDLMNSTRFGEKTHIFVRLTFLRLSIVIFVLAKAGLFDSIVFRLANLTFQSQSLQKETLLLCVFD